MFSRVFQFLFYDWLHAGFTSFTVEHTVTCRLLTSNFNNRLMNLKGLIWNSGLSNIRVVIYGKIKWYCSDAQTSPIKMNIIL